MHALEPQFSWLPCEFPVLGSQGRDATSMVSPGATTHFLRAAVSQFANQGLPNYLSHLRGPLHEREKEEVQRVARCPGPPRQPTPNKSTNKEAPDAGRRLCSSDTRKKISSGRNTSTVLSLSRRAVVEMTIFSTLRLLNTGR